MTAGRIDKNSRNANKDIATIKRYKNTGIVNIAPAALDNTFSILIAILLILSVHP
jgi:hypothetical protein